MKLRWGILSTANIGIQKVIPAIQKAHNCEVVAISSRNIQLAKNAASNLGIEKAYGSYEEMLADPDIDAIYNPLPNHLHVAYSIKALEAGKHVLCEKPIGLNTEEAIFLQNESKKYPNLKLMEAFMYRFHPQWKAVKQWVDEGKIGEVKTIQSFFSYYNDDPKNIRNQDDIGGGALMDIGCYCIQFPRFIFGKEPQRIIGLVDRDPVMKTDRITSGMLDFGHGISSSFTCSTQLQPFQRAQIIGTLGRIEVEIPVNAPADKETKVTVFLGDKPNVHLFGPADQYTVQAEEFAMSVLDGSQIPTPFSDAIANMKIIDAIFESEKDQKWINN